MYTHISAGDLEGCHDSIALFNILYTWSRFIYNTTEFMTENVALL